MGHQPRGDVDGVTQEAELGAIGRADSANHDRSRRDADADLEPESPFVGAVPVQGLIGSDQADRGRHRPIHVVRAQGSVSTCTERRHDSVADELLDHASANGDRADDSLEMRVEHIQQAGRVVCEPLGQSAEAADVGEQDGGGADHRHGNAGSGEQARSAVLVRLPQKQQPREVVRVGGERSSDKIGRNQLATSWAAKDLPIMFAAVSAIPGPLRSTAETPNLCKIRLSAGSRSFCVTTTTGIPDPCVARSRRRKSSPESPGRSRSKTIARAFFLSMRRSAVSASAAHIELRPLAVSSASSRWAKPESSSTTRTSPVWVASRAHGTVKRKRAPLPKPSELTPMAPPCASTMFLQIARPSPVPLIPLRSGLSTRKNLRNTWARASAGIPRPSS